MKYRDLRDFMGQLESQNELKKVAEPVSPALEMTAIGDKLLRAGGPAVLFTAPVGYKIPCLINLFGTPKRVALGMGAASASELRDVGRLLASLKEPEPPKGLKDAGRLLQMAKALWDMKPAQLRSAPCQDVVLAGTEVDLGLLPVQTCWPGDAGPLITWGLVITRGPQSVAAPRLRQNLGIYRQQVIGRNQVIMRWLAHRGGALDFREFARANPGQPFPIAVALGADPATILGAVTPVPDSVSPNTSSPACLRGGKHRAGGLRRRRVPAVCKCPLQRRDRARRPHPAGRAGVHRRVRSRREAQGSEWLPACPGRAVSATTLATTTSKPEFPVFTHRAASRMRRDPIYHSTYTGKPPDEPADVGRRAERGLRAAAAEAVSGNRRFLPAAGRLQRTGWPSFRSRRQYPGHAKRDHVRASGAFLRQFMYTKTIIVVTDDDIDIRDWKEVVWAMTTRMDADARHDAGRATRRSTTSISPRRSAGLGSKMGLDATNKWPGETSREWGRTITMDAAVEARVEAVLQSLR